MIEQQLISHCMNKISPPTFNRATQDIGNIVEFGHVNISVPDQQLAIIFYLMGLGLTRDPYLQVGVGNAWINVGTSQFHLPVRGIQVLRGKVGLVMPDLGALMLRLAGVESLLAGTHFRFKQTDAGVEVICPWGNRIQVHAPDTARFGSLTLGMPYVEIYVAPGTAAGIGRFYRDMLAAAHVAVGQDGQGAFVRIPAYDGHHIQITVADFSGVHRRLLERGLVTEESDASQYRFQDIVDLDSGKVLATLEHEVRSMRHPLYGRHLVNR
jgi:catechol 2,3-dioxygenase-like lactoylglutathione lyase family enzyme